MIPEQATVLVVDDNEMNRDLLARRLSRQQHVVVTAENGREALEKMQTQPFDLVLLDIMMPEMNGFQVLERLKADDTLRHIPVIVISAADDIESIVKCIELGAEDYLPKPYNAALLKARIGASLDKKYLRDKEQARLAEMATMQQIDRELNATLDLKRAMDIALDKALVQSRAAAGLMGTVESGRLQVVTARGYETEFADESGALTLNWLPIVQAAIQNRGIECITSPESGALLSGAQSQIAVPVCRETAVIAVLVLEDTTPRVWDEQIIAFLARLSDHAALAIANAQMYKAVQAANLAKTEFVSLVSHELKIPMTSIKGYADLLLAGNHGPMNEMQSRFLGTIRNNVNRMARLVSDLTDISRIEAGRLWLETSAVSFADVVEEVMLSTRAQIEAKRQQLELDVPADLPPVWGDRMRLIQILTNLVSNAYKYTPEGGRITIRAATITHIGSEPLDQLMLHVQVQDTGLGIKDEDKAGIFGKFYRVKDEEALKSPGTGLGLSITKNLVEMHNGRIWFESQFRQGTTFHFIVPVAPS